MPRRSPEDLAGAVWRAGGDRPVAPARLGAEAKLLWQEIVKSRPIDYFRPGSLAILEQLCQLTVAQRAAMQVLAKAPTDPEAIRTCKELANLIVLLSRQLRLTVITSTRPSSESVSKKTAAPDPLLGGVVQLRPRDGDVA